MKRNWVLYNRTEEQKKELNNLKKQLNKIPESIIEILYNRGFNNIDKIEKHLNCSINDLEDTRLMKDSDKFISIMTEAIKNKDLIINYSDYDIDGIGSSALFLNGIRHIGGNIEYYTNNRYGDGFGIAANGIDKIYEQYPGVKLIVTTDNGIVGFDGVNRAKELGIKVIITDHHTPDVSGQLPDADAVINPHQKDCKYQFKDLCGAGIIFKLLLLLYDSLGADKNYLYSMMDILSISTVGDMVSLTGENRVFVKEGIKLLNKRTNKALNIIADKLDIKQIDEETIGYIYAPSFNALSRLDGTPSTGIDILTKLERDKLDSAITYMINKNIERKELTVEQFGKAEETLNENGLKSAIVLYDESFNEGIVGLIAGRLKEKYNRPVIIFAKHETKDGVVYKGSARSIDGYNLFDGMNRTSKYLCGFGGHALAGGLSVKPEDFKSFADAFIKDTETHVDANVFNIKNVYIDSIISEKDINQTLINGYEVLKPFGMGFEKPKFGLKQFNVDVQNSTGREGIFYPYIGKDSSHLKLVNSNGVVLLAFGQAELYKAMNEPLHLKGIGLPSINIYKNTKTYQFIIENDYMQIVK